MHTSTPTHRYKHHRFPAEIISYDVGDIVNGSVDLMGTSEEWFCGCCQP